MEQRTPEWFAARAGRITASGAGALLGLSPHTSEADGFRSLVRSMHGMPSEFVGNVATEYGTFHEAGALVEYCMETGATVWTFGVADFGNWLGASGYGMIDDLGMVRVYCPFGQRDKNLPKFKGIEEHPQQYARMQLEMYCTDRDWCDFFQWSPHGKMTERVERDDSWLYEHVEKLHAIHQRAKAADPADYAGPKRQEYDTPEAAKLVTEYDELSEAIDNASARKKDIVARMVEMSASATRL